MESLTNWLTETKPTNKYLAWLLLAILREPNTISKDHRKWIYKTAIGYLRLPNKNYKDRNVDWFDDCMKLITAYRNSLKQ